MNESIHEERSASEPQDRVSELIEQQTAISEVLRAIASSPHDLQPIFDAILDSATRLCRADIGSLRLSEESGLRRVAVRGDPLLVSQAWSSSPVLAEKGSLLGRLAASRLATHIPDITALEGDHRDDLWIMGVNAGLRTSLVVPLLKDNEIVGTITLCRKQAQPFTDKQISLFRDFAAQATIALESTRRERRYREMQTELARVNRVTTIGQLTASITHEVNQPLAAARNNLTAALNFLDRTRPDLAEVREALACAVKDNDRASTVVGRIRALMQKAPTRTDSVDLNEAVREVLELTHGEALEHGVSVRTQLADGLPLIQGDRVQLQQVVLNLILNAVQAMGVVADGTREVLITSSQTEPNEVCLGVQDTGPGLSAETLPRLFEPFYTTKPGGMGMGLAICRSIIEAHGGRLWAAGCEPGGALFQFTIHTD
ncbi:MAG TPA: ATP-binding protein [Xanthobacteraceae bacterium]|jgi:signal transduction histidine kinase